MTVKRYARRELAESQLEAAIGLFVSGADRLSVITLAGAADVILARLVLNTGKSTFTDVLLEEHRKTAGDQLATRESHGKQVNDMLFINQLKHFDEGDDDYVELDPEECALAVILKAVANYVALGGEKRSFLSAFKAWMQLNLDPRKYNVNCDPTCEAQPDNATVIRGA